MQLQKKQLPKKVIDKKERTFLPKDLKFEWPTIQPFYEELKQREISTLSELEKWLKDRSELDAALEEDFAWRYIRMNIDTSDQQLKEAFTYFVQEINPKLAPYEDALNRKLFNSSHKSELKGDAYGIMLKKIATQIELFREENIPIFTELEKESQEYGAISAQMSIEYKGKEYTLQQASKFLKSTNREERESVYRLINDRRLKDVQSINELFNRLIEKRQNVAHNCGYDNYRDYMFKAMERFDYGINDCFEFHDSIEKFFVPLEEMTHLKRRERLKLSAIKPWDLSVDIDGKKALTPFKDGKELLDKTKACFALIDPEFADCLEQMEIKNHLDLESKKGKAPGGFNYPLYESGYPFIYMNAAGNFRDVTTMIHEGGHAIHSVLSHHLELVPFKSLTSEIAELASMSMELLAAPYLSAPAQGEPFYTPAEAAQARITHLEQTILFWPFMAVVDAFQHWVYTHVDESESISS